MPPRVAYLTAVLTALALAAPFALAAERPLAWGDQGDGTYANPVLHADYSDPDVIRVGADFYLVASDFHFVGVQVLHSRDLVNWRIVGQVFDRLTIAPKYDQMLGYAQGTWAPSLRHHDGIFYLYVCAPHDGLMRWTAKNPAGPWTGSVVKLVDRWEDPCPFWDDDGQAYLVRGAVGAGPIILHKMSADGSQLLDDGVEIYRGPVAEGPKLFKRRGWYYLSLPEGGVDQGGQIILRSRQLFGPYERREVLPAGSPHQGGIVELDNGESWFLSFKSTGHFGRVVHLNPVHWGEDDWPVFGDRGQPVTTHRKPALPAAPLAHPQRSDDFADSALAPQWQWNHNPLASAWSLTARPGWLRVAGQPADSLQFARNTLTQKLWGPAGAATVKLDVSHLGVGQRAGLAFMCGKIFNPVGLVVDADGTKRVFWSDGIGPVVTKDTVYFRGTYDGPVARVQYSFDGKTFGNVGDSIPLKFSQWKGARLALFSYGPVGGHADFDFFDYEVR